MGTEMNELTPSPQFAEVAEIDFYDAETFRDTPLDVLAEWINEGHDKIKIAVRRMAPAVAQIGAWLAAAKAKLKHGEWLPWLKENCLEISERTAQLYMATYTCAKSNPQLIADLTPTQAYKALGIVKESGSNLS